MVQITHTHTHTQRDKRSTWNSLEIKCFVPPLKAGQWDGGAARKSGEVRLMVRVHVRQQLGVKPLRDKHTTRKQTACTHREREGQACMQEQNKNKV